MIFKRQAQRIKVMQFNFFFLKNIKNITYKIKVSFDHPSSFASYSLPSSPVIRLVNPLPDHPHAFEYICICIYSIYIHMWVCNCVYVVVVV